MLHVPYLSKDTETLILLNLSGLSLFGVGKSGQAVTVLRSSLPQVR